MEEGEEVIRSLLKDIQEVAIEQSQEEDNKDGDNIYQCGECGNSFQTESDVETHMGEEHKEDINDIEDVRVSTYRPYRPGAKE